MDEFKDYDFADAHSFIERVRQIIKDKNAHIEYLEDKLILADARAKSYGEELAKHGL